MHLKSAASRSEFEDGVGIDMGGALGVASVRGGMRGAGGLGGFSFTNSIGFLCAVDCGEVETGGGCGDFGCGSCGCGWN